MSAFVFNSAEDIESEMRKADEIGRIVAAGGHVLAKIGGHSIVYAAQLEELHRDGEFWFGVHGHNLVLAVVGSMDQKTEVGCFFDLSEEAGDRTYRITGEVAMAIKRWQDAPKRRETVQPTTEEVGGFTLQLEDLS